MKRFLIKLAMADPSLAFRIGRWSVILFGKRKTSF